MKLKKCFAILLSVTLSVGVSSGCEANDDSRKGDISESREISVAGDISESVEEKMVETTVIAENIKKPDYKPFNGFEQDENPLNTVNSKEFKPSVFCYNGDNVYFSWKGCVYEYIAKTETLNALFEANAYDLNYYDGYLYYIINDLYNVTSNDRVHISGNIYRYCLSTQTSEIIYDLPVSKLVVYNGDMYFTDYAMVGDELPTGIFKVDSENNSATRLYNGWSYIEYNGFTLRFNVEEDGTKYYFSDGNEKYLLENIETSGDCIVNNDYYYISVSDGSLNRLSMLNGEKTASLCYSGDELPNEIKKRFSLSDYTVFNGEIYVAGSDMKLYRYDEITEEMTPYESDCAFMYLFTDEKDIYAIVRNGSADKYYFAKVVFEESVAKLNILA